MHLLKTEEKMNPKDITNYVLSCQHASGDNFPEPEDSRVLVSLGWAGGFGGNVGHDPHITYTHYAVLCLAMCDTLHRLDREAVIECKPWAVPSNTYSTGRHIGVLSMQQPDGSFAGDEWGEIDTRCICCSRAS